MGANGVLGLQFQASEGRRRRDPRAGLRRSGVSGARAGNILAMSVAERASASARSSMRRRSSSACRKCGIGATRAQRGLRRGRSLRRADGRRRGPGRDRRQARPAVRRPGRRAAGQDAGLDRPAARERLHLQHRQVPADARHRDAPGQPRADARRDAQLPPVSRRADRDRAPAGDPGAGRAGRQVVPGRQVLDHQAARPLVRRPGRHPADRDLPPGLRAAPDRRRHDRGQAAGLARPQGGARPARRAAAAPPSRRRRRKHSLFD